MNRRLPHTPAAPSFTGGEDRPKPACLGNSKPYDLLHDYISGPIHDRAKREAQRICGTCPLQQTCLAENQGEPWAKALLGINPKGGAPKGPIPPCGTNRKFWWHSRNGEPACDPCKAANNAYKRELRAQKATKAEALEVGRTQRARMIQQRNDERTENLHDMLAAGATLHEVCTSLGVSKDTLQKWCSRHGMSDVYRALGARMRNRDNAATRKKVAA